MRGFNSEEKTINRTSKKLTPDERAQIMDREVRDSAVFAKYALIIVGVIELFMIIQWIVLSSTGHFEASGGPRYLYGYAFLFVATTWALIMIILLDADKYAKTIRTTMYTYSVMIVAWVLYIVALDAADGINNILLYVSVIAILPIAFYLSTVYILILSIAADCMMFYIAYKYYDNFSEFALNFVVFAMIMIVASVIWGRIRRNNYLKQIQLENVSNEHLELAKNDSLTGCFNHRTFEESIKEYAESVPENLVVVAMDVDGLKDVNDNLGHDAGDELLKGAADCMRTSLGSYGMLFRRGGDEFEALLFVEPEKLKQIVEDFDNQMVHWHGEKVKTLSVAIGYAAAAENPGVGIDELVRIADKKMYEDKEVNYAQRGIDKRGRAAVYEIMRNSYEKIVRVNLTQDIFSVIQNNSTEPSWFIDKAEKMSDWFRLFSDSDIVHPDDFEFFEEKGSVEYMREYFAEGNHMLLFHYRKRSGDGYKKYMLEAVRAKEYTDENQIIYLLVKDIN